MSTIILYASKTGFSQRYAQTLAEELGCRAVSYQERKALVLEEYDTIILAGGIYAGRMNGLQWLQKQLPALAGKRLAALADELPCGDQITVIPFSSVTGEGVEPIRGIIEELEAELGESAI